MQSWPPSGNHTGWQLSLCGSWSFFEEFRKELHWIFFRKLGLVRFHFSQEASKALRAGRANPVNLLVMVSKNILVAEDLVTMPTFELLQVQVLHAVVHAHALFVRESQMTPRVLAHHNRLLVDCLLVLSKVRRGGIALATSLASVASGMRLAPMGYQVFEVLESLLTLLAPMQLLRLAVALSNVPLQKLHRCKRTLAFLAFHMWWPSLGSLAVRRFLRAGTASAS